MGAQTKQRFDYGPVRVGDRYKVGDRGFVLEKNGHYSISRRTWKKLYPKAPAGDFAYRHETKPILCKREQDDFE